MDVYAYVEKIHQNTSFVAQLIVSLRTAVVIDDWKLDKYHTSHNDVLTHLGLLVLTTRCQKVNGYDRLPLMELFRGSDMRFLKSSSNPLQP